VTGIEPDLEIALQLVQEALFAQSAARSDERNIAPHLHCEEMVRESLKISQQMSVSILKHKLGDWKS